jgi:hypothetical protein
MIAQLPKSNPDAAHNFSAMAEKTSVTVPAAWPSGVSQLAQAYEAYRRCDTGRVCAD